MRLMPNRRTFAAAAPLVPVLLLVAVGVASAGTAGGAGGGAAPLPWEGTLTTLTNVLTGGTARLICIIAIFVAGVALIFGEDLGAFAKRLLMIVIAAAFIIQAGTFATSFLGASASGSLL